MMIIMMIYLLSYLLAYLLTCLGMMLSSSEEEWIHERLMQKSICYGIFICVLHATQLLPIFWYCLDVLWRVVFGT